MNRYAVRGSVFLAHKLLSLPRPFAIILGTEALDAGNVLFLNLVMVYVDDQLISKAGLLAKAHSCLHFSAQPSQHSIHPYPKQEQKVGRNVRSFPHCLTPGNWKESYKPQKERFRFLEHENLSRQQGWRNASPQSYESRNYVETIQGIDSKDLKQQDLSEHQEWLIVSTQVPGYGNCELTFEGKSPRNLKYTKFILWQSLETKHTQDSGREIYMRDSHGFQGSRYHSSKCRKNLSIEKKKKPQKLIAQHSYVSMEEILPKYIEELCLNDLLKDSMEEKYCGCNKCKETYYWNSQYILHKRNQLGEKFYQCSLNTACFFEGSDLYRHPRIHIVDRSNHNWYFHEESIPVVPIPADQPILPRLSPWRLPHHRMEEGAAAERNLAPEPDREPSRLLPTPTLLSGPSDPLIWALGPRLSHALNPSAALAPTPVSSRHPPASPAETAERRSGTWSLGTNRVDVRKLGSQFHAPASSPPADPVIPTSKAPSAHSVQSPAGVRSQESAGVASWPAKAAGVGSHTTIRKPWPLQIFKHRSPISVINSKAHPPRSPAHAHQPRKETQNPPRPRGL
ncbi:zinc finger protein 214 [Myotis yumanensis]|uniref:zinc finger protein 214 n=1 Tax=Myotis yumanensis TaxID=159337 RepID=UPI0038D36023